MYTGGHVAARWLRTEAVDSCACMPNKVAAVGCTLFSLIYIYIYTHVIYHLGLYIYMKYMITYLKISNKNISHLYNIYIYEIRTYS
jgi:hypothetical protein